MKLRFLIFPLVVVGCTTQQPLLIKAAAPTPPVAIVARAAPVPPPKPACKVRVRRDVDRYADIDANSAPDVFRQVAALKQGIAQRAAREAKLETAIRSCGGLTN
jgi:hypothetical protein